MGHVPNKSPPSSPKSPARTSRSPQSPPKRKVRQIKTPSSSESISSNSSDEKEDDLRLRLDENRKKRTQPKIVNKQPTIENEIDDAELEIIRQRALNSMIQNQRQKRDHPHVSNQTAVIEEM